MCRLHALATIWLLLVVLLAPSAFAETQGPARINPEQRLGEIRLRKQDGGFEVKLQEGGRTLSQKEFLRLLYKQQSRRDTNFLFRLFNITSWFNLAWVVVGFLGQICFSGRMLVQWIASEKQGRSVVPVVFWWMSLLGASMLLVYFVWRKDIVGVLGQSTGLAIYLRNLKLIYGHGAAAG
jgi:lipid-A-disaccharide synthase-like uncharacterized protein